MRTWIWIILALTILGLFAVGCAGMTKDTQVKCPKCGQIFTVDEGIEGVRRGLPQAPK